MNGLSKIGRGLIIAALASVILPVRSLAQEEDIFGIERKISSRKSESNVGNVFRNAVSKISFEIAPGYGYHQNRLDFSSAVPEAYPIHNGSDVSMPIGNTGTFEGADYAFPVNAGLRINMFGFFTIGGGYGREFGKMQNLGLAGQEFQLEGTSYTFDKFYGTFGLVLYNAQRRAAFLRWRYRKYSGNNYYMQSELKQRVRQDYPWHFILEGEYGSLKINKSYDSHLSVTEPFYSLGLRIERDFSEYARIFVKPAASFSALSYDRIVSENNVEIPESHTIKQNLYTVNVGLSISILGTKRCKVGGCGVVMKHLHNGVEFRGSSIWKMQDRKVGQWYK